MYTLQKRNWPLVTAAVVGAVFVYMGLWSAALSNPRRFSLALRADAQIHFLAISGFVCTIAGIGLLLTAVSYTTTSMPSPLKNRANFGVGTGFVLQLAGLFLCGEGQHRTMMGLLLILTSLPVFLWGCLNYAEGKGHSKWVGLFGLVGILGLVVLMVLPNQPKQTT